MRFKFTATGLGASSLKLYRKLYIIHLLDLIDIMYNLEINYYYCVLLLLGHHVPTIFGHCGQDLEVCFILDFVSRGVEGRRSRGEEDI